MEELDRYGVRYDDRYIGLFVLTRPLPASAEMDAGMYGAVVPAEIMRLKLLEPALDRFWTGEEKMPRHGIRVVDGTGKLVAPRKIELEEIPSVWSMFRDRFRGRNRRRFRLPSLASYLMFPVQEATGVGKGMLTALITLPVVALVWWMIRRLRRGLE